MSNKKRVFSADRHWHTTFCENNSIYQHLNERFGFYELRDFPCAEQLCELLPPGVKTQSGQPVRFVNQDDIDFNGRAYETVIYQSGQIPTRKDNWHDMFGAFIWCLFPKTKAKLNELHHLDISAHGEKVRTKTRNAITLLDECGVILAITDDSYRQQFRAHQWHWGFVKQRSSWGRDISAFTIGHANYEMLTKPYIGLTGKAIFVDVPQGFSQFALKEQYSYLDRKLCQIITEQDLLKDNSAFSPLPLLGVPGWYPDNEDPTFYQNKDYFRDKR